MTVAITPVNHGSAPGDDTGSTGYAAFQQINTNEAALKASIETLQGRYWLLDNTARALAIGERVVSEAHAGITHTLPATFTLSATALSDIWVWNTDSNSDVTLDTTGTDELFLTGTGQGAGVAITLSPGQLAICSPRVTDVSWNVVVITDWSSGNATASITTTGALSAGATTVTTFTSTGIDDNATSERLQIADASIAVGDESSAEEYGIHLRTTTDGYLKLAGGSGRNSGANIVLHGQATSGTVNDVQFRANTSDTLYYDDSASSWDFQANDITTTGDISATTGKLSCGSVLAASSTDLSGHLSLYGTTYGINVESGVINFVRNGTLELTCAVSSWDFQDNAITTTGALTCAAFTSTGIDDNTTAERVQIADADLNFGPNDTSTYELDRLSNTGALGISGGSGISAGASLTMWGGSHGTLANDIRFRANSSTELYYDDSASSWNFQANAITTTGALTCGTFTSTGIDDNASGERLQIGSSNIQFGTTGTADYGLYKPDSTGGLDINGGTNSNTGGGIRLYGSTHGSFANDIALRGGGNSELYYDHSASSWDFQANDINTTGIITATGGSIISTIDFRCTVGINDTSDIGFGDTGNAWMAGISYSNGSGGEHLDIWTTGGAGCYFHSSSSSTARDIDLYANTTTQLYYDDSASDWDFQANTITWSFTTQDLPFFNFVATANADAVSAISTLNTSGATTDHIQIDLNGTKAWIAVSTNNPS